jgi:hypothetical protein
VALIKHGAPFGDRPDLEDLAQRGIVDPLFAGYLRAAQAEAVFLGPADHALISEVVGAPSAPRLAQVPSK